MHDPMTVAFEIRRPWPKLTNWKPKPGHPRWEVTIYRAHGRDHEGWNPRRWWKPGAWSPFVVAFGRRWYFPSLITVWHVEPHSRDSGEVCEHRRQRPDGSWMASDRWRWHVWHWHVQIAPLRALKRFLFERCIECGRRYPWGYAPVSHQWDGPDSRWFRVSRLNYHHECSALGHLRHERETDEALIRQLVAAVRVLNDESEAECLARLTDPKRRTMGFPLAYRLTRLLGYERDENYDLVVPPAKEAAP